MPLNVPIMAVCVSRRCVLGLVPLDWSPCCDRTASVPGKGWSWSKVKSKLLILKCLFHIVHGRLWKPSFSSGCHTEILDELNVDMVCGVRPLCAALIIVWWLYFNFIFVWFIEDLLYNFWLIVFSRSECKRGSHIHFIIKNKCEEHFYSVLGNTAFPFIAEKCPYSGR